MSVFVQLTGPKHCDLLLFQDKEQQQILAFESNVSLLFLLCLHISHLLLISTDQFYPLAPTRVPSCSIFLHQIWSGFQSSHTSWNTQFFPPPAHFLLFWSCSPPACLSLLFTPPALKLWKGRQIASQSSRQTADSTLDFVRAERDQLLVSGAFSSTRRIDHLKLNI